VWHAKEVVVVGVGIVEAMHAACCELEHSGRTRDRDKTLQRDCDHTCVFINTLHNHNYLLLFPHWQQGAVCGISASFEKEG
jgi:hypothetical protein